MHIGFRYHIASLVAIFFSLFIGILVGSILFQDDLLVQEQDSLIGDLEVKFQDLELRTQELQANLKLAQAKEQVIQDGWDQIREYFVVDQLESVEIVMANINNADLQNRLTALLEQAGAKVIPSFNNKQELIEQLDAEKRQAILYWNDENLQDLDISSIKEIAESGWQVCVLQPYDGGNIDSDLENNSLVIEFADTLIGEIALIQGLAQDVTWGKGL